MGFPHTQDCDGSFKKRPFFLVLLQSFEFSVQILLEKNTPFVRKKFDCEKRDKSIWNALIGCLAQAKFHFRDQKIDFQDLTNSINVKFRYEIIFGRNQCSTSSYEEICVQKTVVTILNYVLDISHNHDFDGSIEGFDISSSFSFTNLRFPMYNLLQKKPIPWRPRSSTTRNELNQPETHSLDVLHCWNFNAEIGIFNFPIPSYAIIVKFPIGICFALKQCANFSYRGKGP